MNDKSDDSCINMTLSEEEQESLQKTISIRSTTTSNFKRNKKKGVFQKEWTLPKEFSSWLQEVKSDCKQARCKACLKTFSIHEGKPALKKHMNSKIHKTHMKSSGNNTLIIHTSFGETQKLSAMEGTFVYHGVKHGHGYISQQCTINLVKDLFASCSSTAKNLACAKTKSRAVACNVLAPYFTSKLIDDISEARFYSISFDASNKGNIKTYPFIVQYFSDIGVKRGILQFVDDPRESASDVFNNAMKVIENYQLDIRNLTSIGADNANVNFGEHHSVFKLFKDLCPCLVKENVLVDIQRAELKLQRVYTTAVDLYGIISNLIKKLEQRLNDKYFGSKTHSILNQLMVFNEDKAKQLQDSFQSFIECVIKYIDSYFDRDRDLFQK
ncbi:unnamed protein product [Rotaria sp. Silwood1]|nr:unnamed protein product [Rotaria sp. Silwood1]